MKQVQVCVNGKKMKCSVSVKTEAKLPFDEHSIKKVDVVLLYGDIPYVQFEVQSSCKDKLKDKDEETEDKAKRRKMEDMSLCHCHCHCVILNVKLSL